jgi:hypothetical protein
MIHLYVSGKFLKAFTSKKKDLERNFIALQFQPFYFQGTLTKIQILLFSSPGNESFEGTLKK